MRPLHAVRPVAGSEGALQLGGARTTRSSLAQAKTGPHSSQGTLLAATPRSAADPARRSLPDSVQPSGGVVPGPIAACDCATPAASPQPATLAEAGAVPSSMHGIRAARPEEAADLLDGTAAHVDVDMELDASPTKGPQQDEGERQPALQPGEQLAQLCEQLCQDHLVSLSQQLQARGLLGSAPCAFLFGAEIPSSCACPPGFP